MEWISVNDRLPEFNTDVLVFYIVDQDREDGVTFSYQNIDMLKEVITNSNGTELIFWETDNVTHWMPLPPTP